jgi:hypothetical protein
MQEEKLPKLIMEWIPGERRKRGRPRKTWMEDVRAAMKTRHLEADQWLNRKEWYKILSFQQMHNLLKHKMLQFLFKGLSYTAPTCFGAHGPSSGSTYQNLTKVTISLKYQLKHFVKIVVLWQLRVSVIKNHLCSSV